MTLTVDARDGALIFRSKDYFVELFGRRWSLPTWLTPGAISSPTPSCPTASSASRCRSSIRASACSSARWRCSGRSRHDSRCSGAWSPFSSRSALFDILYHHELTERLAWRRSQRRELVLHGVRNLIYAVLFLALGWFELHGAWAMLLIAVLAAEVVVTLMDFVEEDMSRKLPASERVTHTLLALNYGAILALLVPVLVGWAGEPTAIVPAWYGIAQRAGAARGRRRRRVRAARRLGGAARGSGSCRPTRPSWCRRCRGRQRVLVTGATGFIGRRLVEALASAGHDVTVLARDPAKAAALRAAVPAGHEPRPDRQRRRASTPSINLAGEPIADALWTRAKRRRILALAAAHDARRGRA